MNTKLDFLDCVLRTFRIVVMNTELALDRHKKVVLPRALRLVTALTMAGC
jgi:hypothetical protein